MSNAEFRLVAVALLGLHVGVLALAVTLRTRPPVLWLVAADAAVVLAWMAFHPIAFHSPVDWPVVVFAVFEALVLVAAAMALQGIRFASAAVWLAFALHTVASGLAVAFALTFKINRLI